MIISHRYKFIFVKTRKVGGTSLEIALSKYLGPDDIVTPISPEDEITRAQRGFGGSQNYRKQLSEYDLEEMRIVARDVIKTGINTLRGKGHSISWAQKYYNHMPASLIRDRIGQEVWDSYFKFTIVRNPWDFAVSLYYFISRKRDISFEDYVRAGQVKRSSNFDLYALDGAPAMDFVVKYENFDQGLAEVCESIGFPDELLSVVKGISAKGQFRKTRDYRGLYNDDLKQIINTQFADEIAHFNYQFEK